MNTNSAEVRWEPIHYCLGKDERVDQYRLVFGIILAFLHAVSLCLLTLLLAIFYKLGSKVRLLAYRLLLSLTCAHVIFVIAGFLTMVPCTLTACMFYSDTVMISIAWTDTLGYYTALFVNCFIAVERISLFLSPRLHRGIERFAIWYMLAPWVAGVAVTVATTAIGCYKRFALFLPVYFFPSF